MQWLIGNTLATDADATFDSVVELKGADIAPQVTWGTFTRASIAY